MMRINRNRMTETIIVCGHKVIAQVICKFFFKMQTNFKFGAAKNNAHVLTRILWKHIRCSHIYRPRITIVILIVVPLMWITNMFVLRTQWSHFSPRANVWRRYISAAISTEWILRGRPCSCPIKFLGIPLSCYRSRPCAYWLSSRCWWEPTNISSCYCCWRRVPASLINKMPANWEWPRCRRWFGPTHFKRTLRTCSYPYILNGVIFSCEIRSHCGSCGRYVPSKTMFRLSSGLHWSGRCRYDPSHIISRILSGRPPMLCSRCWRSRSCPPICRRRDGASGGKNIPSHALGPWFASCCTYAPSIVGSRGCNWIIDYGFGFTCHSFIFLRRAKQRPCRSPFYLVLNAPPSIAVSIDDSDRLMHQVPTNTKTTKAQCQFITLFYFRLAQNAACSFDFTVNFRLNRQK